MSQDCPCSPLFSHYRHLHNQIKNKPTTSSLTGSGNHCPPQIREIIRNLYLLRGLTAKEIYEDLFEDLDDPPMELKRLSEVCRMLDDESLREEAAHGETS